MKIPASPSNDTNASVILTSLVFAGVLTIFVVSTLAVVSNRSTLTTRSAGWNAALPLAEAGIEEALTQIQYSTTNVNTNGWTFSGGTYSRTRTNLASDGYYTVSFVPVASRTNGPSITATGYVRAPMQTNYIARSVRVTTKRNGKYDYAVLVKNGISLSGGSIIDSFDSSNPAYSTNGQYDPTKARDKATVASNSTGNNVNIGTGKIAGYVATGPGGTVTVGSSGAVGDYAYITNSANGGTIQSGRRTSSQNVVFPDVVLPYGFLGGSGLSPGIWNGTNYTYAIGDGDYWIAGFSMGGSGKMVVTGNARLVVEGDFTISGSAFVYIAPNASLEVYVGPSLAKTNPKITISGGAFANGTGNAANLYVGAAPGVQSVTYSGGAAFIGILESPRAPLTMSGSAYGSGALIADSINFSGGMNFHYDENLGGGGKPKFSVASWVEL